MFPEESSSTSTGLYNCPVEEPLPPNVAAGAASPSEILYVLTSSSLVSTTTRWVLLLATLAGSTKSLVISRLPYTPSVLYLTILPPLSSSVTHRLSLESISIATGDANWPAALPAVPIVFTNPPVEFSFTTLSLPVSAM